MNKPVTVSFSDPRPQFHAVSNGKPVYTGSLANVVAYVAKNRSDGFDLQCYVDAPRGQQFLEASPKAEQQVEVYPVEFRLYETIKPGLYLPNMFKSRPDALKHRAEMLNDPDGLTYSIHAVNWRGMSL